MGQKISRAQRRGLGRVCHYVGHMVEHASFSMSLTQGPLAEHFNQAMTDDEKVEYEKLKNLTYKLGRRIHEMGRTLNGPPS